MSIIIESNKSILGSLEYYRYIKNKYKYIPELNDDKLIIYNDMLFNYSHFYNIITIYPIYSDINCLLIFFLEEIVDIISKTIKDSCVSKKLSEFVNFKLFLYIPENNNELNNQGLIKEEIYEKDLVNNKDLPCKCRLYIKEFKGNVLKFDKDLKNITFRL
jgi:hypothetical protein